MLKKDFIAKVSEILNQQGITKKISVPDTALTITDDEGGSKRIVIKIPKRSAQYNQQDVKNIIDACLAVMEDCVKRGDELTFTGIGTLGVKYRAPRMVRAPMSDEWHQVPEHYSPYVKLGNIMQAAARIYGATLKDSQIRLPDPIYDIGDREMDFDEMNFGSEDGDEYGC